MHRDYCVGGIYRSIRFLTRTAQGVRHRGARISLDFRSMAKLAAAGTSGLYYELRRRGLSVGAQTGAVAGLSSPGGNNRHQNRQRNEQRQRDTLRVHGSSRASQSPGRWNCTSVAHDFFSRSTSPIARLATSETQSVLNFRIPGCRYHAIATALLAVFAFLCAVHGAQGQADTKTAANGNVNDAPFQLKVADRPPSFKASFRSRRVACQAGAHPNKTPASIVVARVKSRTGKFRRTSASERSMPRGIIAMIVFSRAHAKPRPNTPPEAAKAKLSIRNWTKIRPREAPTDARTATSFCRVAPRASNRLATLTQAIKRTKPTAPSRNHRPVRTSGSRKSFFRGSTLAPQPLFDFG